jgi:hypothetical protein
VPCGTPIGKLSGPPMAFYSLSASPRLRVRPRPPDKNFLPFLQTALTLSLSRVLQRHDGRGDCFSLFFARFPQIGHRLLFRADRLVQLRVADFLQQKSDLRAGRNAHP